MQIRPDDAFGQQMRSNLEVRPALPEECTAHAVCAYEEEQVHQCEAFTEVTGSDAAGQGMPSEGYQRHEQPSSSHQAIHRQWMAASRRKGHEHNLQAPP